MNQAGQVIILDSGTTTSAIARACAHFRQRDNYYNATNIAAELAVTAVEVILTGGRCARIFFPSSARCEETLRRLSADLLFWRSTV